MKLLVVGDVHLSVTPPGRRAEGYLDELLDMLDEIVELANEQDASVAFIGDLFHHKRWSRVPHWLVDALMVKLARVKRMVLVLPGNHDLADGSMESFDRQPIALLRYLENVRFLGFGAMAYVEHEKDHGIYVTGIPGTAAVTEARPETLPLYTEICDVMLCHSPISERSMPWPTFQPDQLGLQCQVMLYGHQHDQARRVGVGNRPVVVATGAIARGSIHEANWAPSVVLLIFGNEDHPRFIDAQIVPLTKARPAGEIYRWAERAEEQAAEDAMHTFVTALGSASLVGFSRESLVQTIKQRVELPEPVRRMAADILESVGS